jgi:hypothetical protein
MMRNSLLVGETCYWAAVNFSISKENQRESESKVNENDCPDFPDVNILL